MAKLLTLQFIGYLFWGFPVVDLFETETFDGFNFQLKILEIDGEKYFIIASRNVVLGYTHDAFTAFEYYHNASIYTHYELNLLAKGLNLPQS